MSRTAVLSLVSVCTAVGGCVWFVHHNQQTERQRMRAGVVAEREAEAHQKALRAAMQRATSKLDGGAGGGAGAGSTGSTGGDGGDGCVVCEQKKTRFRHDATTGTAEASGDSGVTTTATSPHDPTSRWMPAAVVEWAASFESS